MVKKLSELSSRANSNSVLVRLAFSYIILILLLALTIGASSYYLSTRNYNEEVIKLNNQLLSQYSRNIQESIVISSEETRQKMMLDINLRTDIDILYENRMDLSKINALFKDLKRLVSSSNSKYDSIHIYSKNNQVILSSTLGLEYLPEDLQSDNASPNVRWVNHVPKSDTKTSLWMPTDKVNYSTVDSVNVVSYITTYPSSKSFSEAKGYIRIDISEDYISSLLKNIDIGGKGQLFLIDTEGNISSHSDDLPMPSTIQDIGFESMDIILESPTFESNIMVNGVETIVSYTNVNDYWMLVRAVPVSEFYSVSKEIALSTAMICLIAVIASGFIASLFTSNIYAPLKRIAGKLTGFSGKTKSSNEYDVINTAIDDYDSQLNAMSKRWEDNVGSLKQNLLGSIINNRLNSEEAFRHRLTLIGHVLPSDCQYNIIYLKIENAEQVDITPESPSPTARLIDYIGSLNSESTQLIASAITSRSIVIFVIFKAECIEESLSSYLNSIITYSTNMQHMDVSLSYGLWKSNIVESHMAYSEALDAAEYHFFQPDRNIFDYSICNRQSDTDTKTNLDKLYQQYSSSLKSDDLPKATETIESFINHITVSSHTIEVRYDSMRHMVSLLRDYTKDYYMGTSDIDLNFSNLRKSLSDIYDYSDWLKQATGHILELKKNQKDRKLDDIVQNIKQYIHQNLADDLSLTRLSEYTTLSNSYLSHIFKETTGVNVVDYITEQRMVRAKSLLETTSLNIELVASACGFATPHYFSKKFKQFYGLTPRSYRIAYGEKIVSPEEI